MIIFILLIIFIILGVTGGCETDMSWLQSVGYGINLVTNVKIKDYVVKDRFLNITTKQTPLAVYYGIKPSGSYSYGYWADSWHYPKPSKYHDTITALEAENPFNMPIQTKVYKFRDKSLTVIRDDLLPGGTKQRALYPYIKHINKSNQYNTFVYAGPTQGIAQLALGVVCKYLGLHAVMFYSGKPTDITTRAINCGVEMHVSESLHDAQQAAQQWCRDNGACLLPFGLHDSIFMGYLIGELRKVTANLKVERMWLIVGSGTLLKCLYHVFPTTYFMVVQVGKKIWPDQYDPARTRVFVAPQKFKNPTSLKPPYPSVLTYDAKIWQFVDRWAQSGDWIWNVAA